jgi:hypothetical protein
VAELVAHCFADLRIRSSNLMGKNANFPPFLSYGFYSLLEPQKDLNDGLSIIIASIEISKSKSHGSDFFNQ